jgi:hypothetical protein
MSRTFHDGDRRIRVKGIRRPTDLRRLARVLIDLEAAKAEAEAEAEYRKRGAAKRRKQSDGPSEGPDRKAAA